MSKLTEQVWFKDIKGDVVGHLNSNGFEYFVKQDISQQQVVNKLGQLEDVLEEFGIESAEELRERLTKAIVPKFETRQNVFAIFEDAYYDECGVCEGTIEEFTIKRSGRREYYICSKERSFFVDEEYIFTTEAEAQAKLDELKQGEERFGRLKN